MKAAIIFEQGLDKYLFERIKKDYREIMKIELDSISKEDLIYKPFKEEERKMYLTEKDCRKLNGKKVTCVIDGEEIKDAEIVVCGDNVSIAQNVKDGTGVKVNRYKYSWQWDYRTEKVQLVPPYTYLEREKPLPSWWDGRPIFGGYSDCSEKECLKDEDRAYCVGILPNGQFLIINDENDNSPIPYKYFVPEEMKTHWIWVEVDGERKQVSISDKELEKLGFKVIS